MAQLSDLIDPLLGKTLERKIPWKASDNTEIYFKLGNQIIEVDYYYIDTNEYVSMIIRDQNGKVVDNYSPSSISNQGESIKEIHELGRRQALKIDEAIDEVQRQLEAL